MYFFIKYIVTLFYKKLRIKIVVSFLCESGPWTVDIAFSSLTYKIFIKSKKIQTHQILIFVGLLDFYKILIYILLISVYCTLSENQYLA